MNHAPTSFITAAEAACSIGNTLADCENSILCGQSGLRPLSELLPVNGLESLLAGWIADRTLLLGRRYGVATNAALQVARRAVAQANWTPEELSEAWIFAATSRGNAAESFGHTGFRRPAKRFAASNTLPSEIPAAISIELGIHGPWQLLSNACAAGLDALGMAHLAVASGAAPRALVVAVELPLIPELLLTFRHSGLLARDELNDPYHPKTNGLHPAEAVAAITLEAQPSTHNPLAEVLGYWASSDAYHALSVPEDGRGIRRCLDLAMKRFPKMKLGGICPHATGTAEQGRAEQRVLGEFLQDAQETLPLALLKPFTGHSLGASGLLETAILAKFLQRHSLPPNLPSLTGNSLSTKPMPVTRDQVVLNMASGMGGHNALVALRSAG